MQGPQRRGHRGARARHLDPGHRIGGRVLTDGSVALRNTGVIAGAISGRALYDGGRWTFREATLCGAGLTEGRLTRH